MYVLTARAPTRVAADHEAAEDSSFCGHPYDADNSPVEWDNTGALNRATGARDVIATADNREDLEPYLSAACAAGWAARLDHGAVVALYVQGEGRWSAQARPDEGAVICWDPLGAVRLPPYDTIQDLVALLDEQGAL